MERPYLLVAGKKSAKSSHKTIKYYGLSVIRRIEKSKTHQLGNTKTFGNFSIYIYESCFTLLYIEQHFFLSYIPTGNFHIIFVAFYCSEGFSEAKISCVCYTEIYHDYGINVKYLFE